VARVPSPSAPNNQRNGGAVSISQSSCVLRASGDKPEHPVLDDYVYATTSPIYGQTILLQLQSD
jgi:hypothetical protein